MLDAVLRRLGPIPLAFTVASLPLRFLALRGRSRLESLHFNHCDIKSAHVTPRIVTPTSWPISAYRAGPTPSSGAALRLFPCRRRSQQARRRTKPERIPQRRPEAAGSATGSRHDPMSSTLRPERPGHDEANGDPKRGKGKRHPVADVAARSSSPIRIGDLPQPCEVPIPKDEARDQQPRE